jgi:transcriptional regulator with XRE-family HTH domain
MLSLVKTSDAAFRQLFCHAILCDMENDDKPFGAIAYRLKWHRALEGTTQTEYAKKAGLKRAQLNNWESGDFRMSIDGALALRVTYGLSLDFMYEGIDDALPMTLRQAWRERPRVNDSK